MVTVVGKSAYQRFEEGFAEAFLKKEAQDKPPETNEDDTVQGAQAVNAEDPGEVGEGDEWDGDDPEQYSPDVKDRAADARDGVLSRSFVAPPSPKGHFKKVSHAQLTMQDTVKLLCNRR